MCMYLQCQKMCVCISLHVHLVFASPSARKCLCMHDTSPLFTPFVKRCSFSAPAYLLIGIPRTRTSGCQRLVFPAAWLCTCHRAICASSWCLAAITRFSCPEYTLPVFSAFTLRHCCLSVAAPGHCHRKDMLII